MSGRTLMVQGTCSSAGKSLLVAALCRIFARRGLRVAPFKAQNMSNNAAVCPDGAEIGRSQALQAAAAGVEPTADMNPILLKPEAEARSQVIVNGRVWKTLPAGQYYRSREELWPAVTTALDRLRSRYELVLIEGAGSPAELNLRQAELVNMAVARYARSPVILAGDIERGGVFAQLLGTLWLLDEADRALIGGLLVNKLRGDVSLFADGIRALEERGGVPVLGVVPWLPDLQLPEEDSVALDGPSDMALASGLVDIAVIQLPRISNFDDFDPLSSEPGVRLRYVTTPERLGRPDAVILPGTKSTAADLLWLRESGLAERIVQLSRQGICIVGICGGYQMLGRNIRDPQAVESSLEDRPGLGLLPIETVFADRKETRQVQATIRNDVHCAGCSGEAVTGYEIHMARTTGGRPWLRRTEPLDQEAVGSRQTAGETASCLLPPASWDDGAVSDDGRIWGCYLHGLFHNDGFRRAWLRQLRSQGPSLPEAEQSEVWESDSTCWSGRVEQSLDRLAQAVEQAIDMETIEHITWSRQRTGAES